MLTGLAFTFLSLLPAHAAGQLTFAEAKCSPGFDWLLTSVKQSPCDVAVELGGICVAGQFNISQLSPGNVYFGPTVSSATSCRCSSVYYSLLSACAYCQQHNYIGWSAYNGNCSKTYVTTFPQPVPLGVKVPRWAYQDVSAMDIFDINIANATDKPEGPPPTTTSGISSPSPSPPASSSDKKIGVIAATVGGLVGLCLIGGLVAFCLIRRKKRSSKTSTKLEPVSTQFNRPPEVTRPIIPGFSAPSTPFLPSGAHLTPPYHVPNSANTSPPTGYPASVAGTSDIYESSPVLLPNIGERYHSSAIPLPDDRYYDPQSSLSTVPTTTDIYWAQSSSTGHPHPAGDRYYDSPVPSAIPMHQTGDSRNNDRLSPTTYRQSLQSSVVSSPQSNRGTTSTSAGSRTNLLPPAYTDIVDGASRRPLLPEKQGL